MCASAEIQFSASISSFHQCCRTKASWRGCSALAELSYNVRCIGVAATMTDHRNAELAECDRAWDIATLRRCDAGDEATGIARQQLSALAAFSGCPMVSRDESGLSNDVPVHQICDQRGTSIWFYINIRDG